MNYKKGQWLKCESEIDGFTKGNTYKISGTAKYETICVYVDSGDVFYFDRNDIIKYFSPAPKTLYTLEVGDIIVDNDGNERMVLEVFEHSFMLSFYNDFLETGIMYTSEEAKQKNWTIKGAEDTDDKPREVTMKEVCKKFGEDVKIIKD